MSEKQIKSWRIAYFSAAALFIIFFMMTGRFLYVFFASVCMTIGINPEVMKRPKQ